MYSLVPSSLWALSIACCSFSTSSSRRPGWAGMRARTATGPDGAASLMAPDRTLPGAPSEAQPVSELAEEVVDRHPYLLGGVPVADRDRLVLQRLEVYGDAERSTDLVLAAVPPPDGLGLVVLDHVTLADGPPDLPGQRRQRLLLGQRQDGDLVRRQAGMEPQHRARLAVDDVLVVRR